MNFLRRMWFGWMYWGKPPWDTGISPPELLEFISSHTPGRALDLGCGTGTNAITLASRGWQMTGIDFAGRAIRRARRKAQQAAVEIDFRQGDVTNLKAIAGPFDLVLDIGCFHSLDMNSRQKYAANLPGIMAPDSTFLLYAWMDEEGDRGMGLQRRDLELLTADPRKRDRLDEDFDMEVEFRSSTQPTDFGSTGHRSKIPLPVKRLRLVERQDGTERGSRPSAWLMFQCEAV